MLRPERTVKRAGREPSTALEFFALPRSSPVTAPPECFPMITIKVVSYNNERPSAPMEALFDSETKTLGRSNDNHLVLTDPKHFVSRMQASVRSEGDQHIIINL